MIIYLVTGPTGLQYVGATTQPLNTRRAQHKHKHTRLDAPLYRDMISFGFDSFTFEPIDTASTVDEMFEKEKLSIAKLKTFAEGYNQSTGGRGATDYKQAAQAKEAKRIASKKRWADPSEAKKMLDGGIRKITQDKVEQARKSALGHAAKAAKAPKFEVVNRITGKSFGIFNSTKKVSDLLGLHITTVRRSLDGRNNRRFIFSYCEG